MLRVTASPTLAAIEVEGMLTIRTGVASVMIVILMVSSVAKMATVTIDAWAGALEMVKLVAGMVA